MLRWRGACVPGVVGSWAFQEAGRSPASLSIVGWSGGRQGRAGFAGPPRSGGALTPARPPRGYRGCRPGHLFVLAAASGALTLDFAASWVALRSGRGFGCSDARVRGQNDEATIDGASVTIEAGGRGSSRAAALRRPERSELVLDARAAATTITREAGHRPASWLPSFVVSRS